MSNKECRKFEEAEIECIDYMYYVKDDPIMHRVHESGEPMIDPDFPGRWLTGYDCVCAAWYKNECICGAFERNAYK